MTKNTQSSNFDWLFVEWTRPSAISNAVRSYFSPLVFFVVFFRRSAKEFMESCVALVHFCDVFLISLVSIASPS